MQEIPAEKRTSWRFHVVHAGESLDTIATTFHDRPSDIASANALAQDASIKTGDELVVPVSIAVAMPHPLHYTTRSGDTLVTIADRFNVSVEDLRRWNHLSSSTIKPQHSLFVSQPVRLAPVAHLRAKQSHTAGSAHTTASTRATSTHSTSNASGKHPQITSTSAAKTSSHSATTKKKTAHSKQATASK